jgi:hypothetical protein
MSRLFLLVQCASLSLAGVVHIAHGIWLKAYRSRHEIASWPALMTAVTEKFGADDHRKFMKRNSGLMITGSL